MATKEVTGVAKREGRQVLCLVWKNPATRQRYLIGYLSQDEAGYHFRYDLASPRSLKAAVQVGFVLPDAFPDPEGEWHSDRLFPVFARRLPRGERAEGLKEAGVPFDDPIEFLRLTGGRLVNDTLEFLEPIEPGERAGEYSVRFPVAGWRYYEGEAVIDELRPGAKVWLELEPDNPFDPSAIRVLSSSRVHVGYVPAIYSWYLDDAVSRGDYRATVDRLGPKEDPQQRVMVHFQSRVRSLPNVTPMPKGIDKYVGRLKTPMVIARMLPLAPWEEEPGSEDSEFSGRRLEDLHLDTQNKAAVLEVKRRLQAQVPEVKKLVIFGSVARGQAGPDSDLDLLALTKHELPRDQKKRVYDIIFDVNLQYGTNLSIVCLGEELWNLGPFYVPIRSDVEREGVLV